MTYSWSSDELVRWLCKAVCSPGRMAITITNHLAACCLSEMASCFINDLPSVFRVPVQKFFGCWVSRMAITNDLPSVFCWVITSHLVVVFWQPSGMASSFISQMASSHISCFIREGEGNHRKRSIL